MTVAQRLSRWLAPALAVTLAACGATEADTTREPTSEELERYEGWVDEMAQKGIGGARDPMPAYFDCVREAGGVLIAAHRGGPVPGYPENALETMQYNLERGILLFEVDVAESQDGVLFLMHDRSLGRTTTGGGQLVEFDWEEIAALNLVDNDGQVTDFSPPKLSDVLLWATDTGAIVQLDRKSSTSFRNIISAVRAAEAEDHAMIITYDTDQAQLVAMLAPDLMVSASARGAGDIAELEEIGLSSDRLLAWTGTRAPDPAAWQRLSAEGVEAAFGTLGRPGDRLDDAYLADGNPSEFQDLVDGGLTVISTDVPLVVADALSADERAVRMCGGR